MKINFLLLALMCYSLLAIAQTEEETTEPEVVVDTVDQKTTITVEFGKINDFDSTKNLTTRWFTFGLGINPVMYDGKLNLPSQPQFLNDWDLRLANSTHVELGIVQQKLNIAKHKLNLVYGVGLDFNKFSFENDFVINPDADTWIALPTTENTKKNRLAVGHLSVPLMLNFESNTQHYKSFRINAGGFGALRIKSNQKIKYEEKVDGKKRYKEKDNFNLNNFKYGLQGEIGFGPINLYTKYHLNDLFKDDATTHELNTLDIGIMLVPF